MIAAFDRSISFAVLAVCLTFSAPALAQNSSPPPPAADAPSGHGDWDREAFENQNAREEMEQIRKEHEDLEETHDRLRQTCGDAKGPQTDMCQKERQDLRDRWDKLHERRKVLHDKIEAMRKEREEHGGNGGANRQPPAPPAPLANR